MRSPVFGVVDQIRHKPGSTIIEDGLRLEISDLRSRGLYYICSENKGADQVTAQLICVFVFAYAKSHFFIMRLLCL